MGEKVGTVYNNDQVQQVYHQSLTLKKADDWNIPNYQWDVDHIQQLQHMSLNDLVERLRKLIAAKLGMEDLQKRYDQQTNAYLNKFNNSVEKQETEFKQYAYLNQHPNEAAYFKAHPEGYPKLKPINYRNTRPAFWSFIISFVGLPFVILLSSVAGTSAGGSVTVGTIFLGLLSVFGALLSLLTALMIPTSVLFYIFAKLNLKFSQPWASFLNYRAQKVHTDITKADDEYCKANNRYDEPLLRQEFKYPDVLTAFRGEYVEEMKALGLETNTQLHQYEAVVNANVGYFPPADTQNMQHLFRIYLQFWNGRAADWQTATTLVDQSEQMDKLKDSLVAEIHSATKAVIASIDEARSEITNAIDETNEAIIGVKHEVQHMTNAVNYWGTVQTELSAVQTSLIAQADARIGAYHRR